MKPNNCKLIQIIRQQVIASIAPYRAILLAFSGGLDSTVLLDVLSSLCTNITNEHHNNSNNSMLAITLRAIHVHHGLSQYADEWVTHCARECQRRNVLFSSTRVILKDTNKGIEAAARNARYWALANTLIDKEVLLTAHHQDDQAETLLLALKRGSGPAGLASMPADALFYNHRLIRPLLGCNRAQLEAYAHEFKLNWVEDDSNNDHRFDRNFLRLKIMPSLQQRWPKFTVAAARCAQLCAEQEDLLDEMLKETLALLIQPDGSLELTELKKMSSIRRAAILRRWLASQGIKMPSRLQLVRIWQEVVLSRCDAIAQLYFSDRLVRRFKNRLYLLPQHMMFPDRGTMLYWSSASEYLTLPLDLGTLIRYRIDAAATLMASAEQQTCAVSSIVHAPLSDEQVSIRFGTVNGLLHITGRRHGRPLKKLWQELNVPPWQRNRTPLLFYSDTLITAIGVFVTREGEIHAHQDKWCLYWQQNN